MADVVSQIVNLWSDINPVAGYTSGHLQQLTGLFLQTPDNVEAMHRRFQQLRGQLDEIADHHLRFTADAVLVSLRTSLDLARPSGAGPSGTGMGGVYAAADGIFYILLKQDHQASWVPTYLEAVRSAVQFETRRWFGLDFTIEVRRECLDTASYMKGTLQSLVERCPAYQKQCDEIQKDLNAYQALFSRDGLDSNDFNVYWPLFCQWDEVTGPVTALGYPACLQNYYQLTETAAEIEIMARSWLDLDIPVTAKITEQVAALPFVQSEGPLQEIWDKVTKQYYFDFKGLEHVVNACNDYGARYIIEHTKDDHVYFAATPDYLINLITGGEDFAINYLNPQKPFSQLYLTQAKNTSLLTMINILVHEASHGFNFVLSAKYAASPLLNLNTALEVPMTEGMAYYREYQYWAAAQSLLGRSDLHPIEQEYLNIYGQTQAEQVQGVLCAQLETYIWRVIRSIRALCDVQVNGGKITYTKFISWAADVTGLSLETLHGECFPFLASPGYAPCYAIGGASYAVLQKRGIPKGVTEIDFNTFASRLGFYAWPIAKQLMHAHVCPARNARIAC